MPRPKRQLQAAAEDTLVPPASLEDSQIIARVVKAEGNNLYTVTTPYSESVLVELAPKFRSTIWIKRGGYVVIDESVFDGRKNKLGGSIVNIVGNERSWRKAPFWPLRFTKQTAVGDWYEDDAPTIQMSPSDASDDQMER